MGKSGQILSEERGKVRIHCPLPGEINVQTDSEEFVNNRLLQLFGKDFIEKVNNLPEPDVLLVVCPCVFDDEKCCGYERKSNSCPDTQCPLNHNVA